MQPKADEVEGHEAGRITAFLAIEAKAFKKAQEGSVLCEESSLPFWLSRPPPSLHQPANSRD